MDENLITEITNWEELNAPLGFWNSGAGVSYEQHYNLELNIPNEYFTYYSGREIHGIEVYNSFEVTTVNFIVVPLTKLVLTYLNSSTGKRSVLNNISLEGNLRGSLTMEKLDQIFIRQSVIVRPTVAITGLPDTIVEGNHYMTIKTIYK